MHMNWAGAKFDLHIQINEHSILLVVGISQIFCSVLNKGHLGVTVLTVFWENQKMLSINFTSCALTLLRQDCSKEHLCG